MEFPIAFSKLSVLRESLISGIRNMPRGEEWSCHFRNVNFHAYNLVLLLAAIAGLIFRLLSYMYSLQQKHTVLNISRGAYCFFHQQFVRWRWKGGGGGVGAAEYGDSDAGFFILVADTCTFCLESNAHEKKNFKKSKQTTPHHF